MNDDLRIAAERKQQMDEMRRDYIPCPCDDCEKKRLDQQLKRSYRTTTMELDNNNNNI